MPETRTRRRLFRRLFALFAVSALLPIGILALQGYHCARLAILRTTGEKLSALAGQARGRITELLADFAGEAARLANVAGTDPAGLRRGDPASRKRMEAERLACPHGLFILASLDIVDADGTTIASLGEREHPRDPADAALLARARETRKPVFGPVHVHEDEAVVVHVACAIPAASAEPEGFIISAVDLALDIAPALRAIASTDPETRIEVIDGEGRAIIAVPEMPPGRRRERTIDARGEIAGMGWTVIAEISHGRALAALRPFIAVSAATAGAACLLILGLAWFFARRVAAPIADAAAAARRIAAGDLATRARYDRPDEVGDFTDSFNAMVDGLLAARKRLVQSETLAAVGRVATSIVHELRNPLSAIKMNLQLLARRLAGEPPFDSHGRIALDGIRKLETMLDELLELGRPIEPKREPMDPAEAARRAAQAAEPHAAAKRVRIDVAAGDATRILADPDRIERAILNLILNAIDASPEGGMIQVRIGSARGREVTIEVLDSGAGIRPDHIEAVFDPFFTTKEKGTGLGLPIVRKIVQLHGGDVRIENRPEGGVRAALALPVDAEGPCAS